MLVPRGAAQELWVFMPATSGTELHVPTIEYADNGAPKVVNLHGKLATVTGTGAGNVRTALAGLHGHQTRIHGAGVPSAWFGGATPARVAARVRIEGATSLAPRGGTVRWEYDGRTDVMHTNATCIVQVAGSTIDVVVDSTTVRIPVQPGGSAIQVRHVPAHEHQPPADCPGRNKPPHHWHFYRTMLGIPQTDTRMPRLNEDCPPMTSDREEGHAQHPRAEAGGGVSSLGVSPYSCMMVPGCEEGDPACP